MRMTNRSYTFAMLAMLTLSGGAVAADANCPAASSIKEAGKSNAGKQEEETNYIATENGKTWKGSVSAYDDQQADLKDLTAGKATTANKDGLVACDYSNKNNVVTLRLTNGTPKAVAPLSK